jgi:hypothetical protein
MGVDRPGVDTTAVSGGVITGAANAFDTSGTASHPLGHHRFAGGHIDAGEGVVAQARAAI